jgi:hypothetical protein
MQRYLSRIAVCSLVTLLCSCVGFEGIKQAQDTRQFMTEDLESQIMFNLIRAKNGMPFAQYDIQQLQSVVSSKATPQGGLGRTTTTSSFPGTSEVDLNGAGAVTLIKNIAGTATGAVQSIVRPYTATFGYERDNTLTVTINPVTDNPNVYAAYVTFLNFDNACPKPPKQHAAETDDQGEDYNTLTEFPTKKFPVKEVITTTKGDEQKTTIDQMPKDPKPALTIYGFGENIRTIVARKNKPAPGTYVRDAIRFWGGDWYYVPCCYTRQFVDLWLSLVAKKPVSKDNSSVTSLLQRNVNTNTNIQNSLQQMSP